MLFNPRLKSAAVLLMILFPFSCSQEKEPLFPEMELEGRESILDRKVHIEPELITDIPQVERWCGRLDLKKYRINVGDADLYVEEEGKGTPMVLINGGPGGTHHYFHPWFSKAEEYARVIYYDQRGCGLSDFEPGEEGYSVHQAVKDLDAVRKALNIDKWVVLGYSYGGFLAQYYTVHYPENTAGLILLSASPGMHADTGKSRQDQFMSEEEKARLKEISKQVREFAKKNELSPKKFIQILLYNNFLNGDWKRQNFFKPTKKRLAEIALYEWDHDKNFNIIMSMSKNSVDLTGVFDNCPIPTLILEGKYDLTWGEKKRQVLKGNHPNAGMVVFENAGHGIYDEEPKRFFAVLKDFIKNLPEIKEEEMSAFKSSINTWKKKRESSPDKYIQSLDWGWSSSRKLIRRYSRKELEKLQEITSFLRAGFAHYDMKNYEEALFAFEKMQKKAAQQKKESHTALALIWQGHMLDMLGKREDAVNRYQKAARMNHNSTWMHSQYGMEYSLSPYARDRIKIPFKRIENRTKIH